MNIQVRLLIIVAIAFPFSSTSSVGLQRIVNGSAAKPKELPYQVFYDILRIPGGWYQDCGGTIISPRLILTAAHCLTDEFTHIELYFGAVDKNNVKEKGQQRLLLDESHVVIHEDYDEVYRINDIALIRLPTDLEFDDYIQPANLPQNNRESFSNQPAVVSGWGLMDYGNEDYSNILQRLNVQIISNAECKAHFLSQNPGRFFASSFICLKPPKNAAPCHGDSGGPLVVKDASNKNVLIGITSYSAVEWCNKGEPAIYTRVSSHLEWILEKGRA